MILCYIDDSGTPDIPGNSSHFVLAGLAIPINRWKQCENEVQSIKQKYRLPTAEIHTGWIRWPYLEQSKINDFENLIMQPDDMKLKNTGIWNYLDSNP
jgi:hypothetical protein